MSENMTKELVEDIDAEFGLGEFTYSLNNALLEMKDVEHML